MCSVGRCRNVVVSVLIYIVCRAPRKDDPSIMVHSLPQGYLGEPPDRVWYTGRGMSTQRRRSDMVKFWERDYVEYPVYQYVVIN
jgi:hypothetical protein